MWVFLLVLFLGVLIGLQQFRIRAIRSTQKAQTVELHDVTDQVLEALAEARAEEAAGEKQGQIAA